MYGFRRISDQPQTDGAEAQRASGRRAGFTLLELLLTVSILAAVSALVFMSFGTVITAWKRGMALSDDLQHGDYVIEQLLMGLRSAYQPDAKGRTAGYGFELKDNGDDPYGSDLISWVKLGGALIGTYATLVFSLLLVATLVTAWSGIDYTLGFLRSVSLRDVVANRG